MFRRVESDSKALVIPSEWTNKFKQTLLKIYGDKCLKDDKTFEIYAFTYPEEVLLIVSYLGLDQNVLPVTLSLSADLNGNENPEKTLDILCDSVGIFYDHYFAVSENSDEIFDEYSVDWEKEEIKNIEVHFKVTRENVGLTLAANQLLGDDF